MKLLFRVIVLLLFFGCQYNERDENTVVVQEKKPEVKKVDSLANFLRHYEKFFKTNFNISECPGAAIVIVKDSLVVYKKGFGVKKINTQDSVDVNTVFRIASLSKGVTAVLAGNLVDQGELNWKQRIKESVTTFDLRDKNQANRLNVNHLMSHTAGLHHYANTRMIQRGMSLERIISRFKRNNVVAKEGTDYEYQNAAFSIIEKVMEKETGKTFETLLKERLFDPSGMNNATCTYLGIKNNDNVALPHRWNNYSKKYRLTRIHKNYYNVAAAGGVNASISDMGEFLKVLLGNRTDILSNKNLKEIFNPMICTSKENTYVNLWGGVTDTFYAKGWRVLDYEGRTIIYHGGNVNQYKSQLMIDPTNGIAVCILFNAPNPFNGVAIPTFLNYYDFFLEMNKS